MGLPAIFPRNRFALHPLLDPSLSLYAWYKCDEASGDLLDASPNLRHMTDTNTCTATTGVFGGARVCTQASTEYFTRADESAQNFTNKLTLCYWIKPTTLSVQYHITKYNGTGGQQKFWAITLNGSGDVKFSYGNNNTAQINAVLSVGTWTHLAWVYDGDLSGNANRGKLYVNTVQATVNTFVNTIPASLPSSTAALQVGKEAGTAINTLNAAIDEIAIWAAALTQPQVALHYATTYPG